MRIDDITVELIPTDATFRELPDGRVLARPDDVYAVRIRNHARRRAVADIEIDGRSVSKNGLVIPAGGTVDLERPLTDGERGRFTVLREGHDALGPDGGRDNPSLGLVEVRVRHERRRRSRPYRRYTVPYVPLVGPQWSTSQDRGELFVGNVMSSYEPQSSVGARPRSTAERDVEGAAGTGLTGRSDQRFIPVTVGPMESGETVVRLRLVLGRQKALDEPRPLPGTRANPAPPRPKARP